jgi:class 3 adenylate cyclase
VGAAVHALFNAPNDLEEHPRKAIECAIALRVWSETFRHRPKVATIGLGRTRIGLETGPAIVGDVGIRAKPDYTAHGDAVNVAARLEAANKELGSSICIGSVAASRCDQSLLRPIGKITVRGRADALRCSSLGLILIREGPFSSRWLANPGRCHELRQDHRAEFDLSAGQPFEHFPAEAKTPIAFSRQR